MSTVWFITADAVETIEPALEARLKDIRVHAELSRSTDGGAPDESA
jgi:hypothetical protein